MRAARLARSRAWAQNSAASRPGAAFRATAAVAASGGGAPPAPPPLRRLPPPPPSLLYLLRTGRPTNAAHAVWAAVIGDGDRTGQFAVDATAGLGGDTVGLARLLGPGGRVLALDTQRSALAATAAAVEAASSEGDSLAAVDLRLACHSTLGALLAGEPAAPVCIAFNLGYLPAAGGACKEATVAAAGSPVTAAGSPVSTATTPSTTLPALEGAAGALAPGGVLTVAAYVGHPGGPEEADAVRAFLAGLDAKRWVVSETRLPNRPTAPTLSVAYKKRTGE